MQKLLFLAVMVLAAAFLAAGCNTNRSASSLPPIEPVGQLPSLEEPDTTIASSARTAGRVFPEAYSVATEVLDSVRYHTIGRGDTLWSVALVHYGNGQRWRDIVVANPGIEQHKLRIGHEIVVP